MDIHKLNQSGHRELTRAGARLNIQALPPFRPASAAFSLSFLKLLSNLPQIWTTLPRGWQTVRLFHFRLTCDRFGRELDWACIGSFVC